MNNNFDPSRIFTSAQIDRILKEVIGKTLLQVDKAGIFQQHAGSEKVTGIAGHIIEASVLGCKIDSKQEADILIDEIPHEVKTTGMVKPKRSDSPYIYEYTEHIRVTDASNSVIVAEDF